MYNDTILINSLGIVALLLALIALLVSVRRLKHALTQKNNKIIKAVFRKSKVSKPRYKTFVSKSSDENIQLSPNEKLVYEDQLDYLKLRNQQEKEMVPS